MRKIVIAASVLVGIALGFLGFQVAKSLFLASPDASDLAEIDARLMEEDVALLRYMRAEMPDEYQALLEDLSEHIAVHGADGVSKVAFAATAGIRTRNSGVAAAAPDGALREVLETQRETMARLVERYGGPACAPFAVSGGGAVPDLVRRELALFDSAAIATFRAIVAGRNAPKEREPTTEADWRALVAKAVDRGMTREEIALMGDPDPKSPELCRVGIGFLDAALALEGPAGERIRASIVRSVMGSG